MSAPNAFTRHVPVYYLCAAVIVVCALWFNLRAYHAIGARTADLSVPERHERNFSYIEDDYPTTLIPPAKHPRNAVLVMEETAHYFPNASQDWKSMLPTGSEGSVRLGPHKRLFAVSMYHQLQCLGILQQATVHNPESDGELDVEGLHHCLNYLRQSLLCAANVRLEPVKNDPISSTKKSDGIALEHRCRDWTLVRREVEANSEQWSQEYTL